MNKKMSNNKVEERINHNYYKQIADKITQLLDKIHDSQLSSKRWVWELMQNAKDVPNKFGRVSVRIELWSDKLIFRHNGDYFTDGNITGLIQQVSSKDSANEGVLKQTGKFGTGFITTHLLSNIIDVDGVVKNPNTNEFQHFTLHLDRSARKSEDLIKNITDNLEWVKGLDTGNYEDFPLVKDYENRGEDSFDTSFTYYLSNDSLKSAQVGLEDLINTLPITMVSLHEIKSVEIINHVGNIKQVYTCENEKLEKNVDSEIIRSVIDINDKKKYYLTYKTYENKVAQVALSIETLYENGKYTLVKRGKEQPVLFRDFPLIGSENFYFPYILNGFDFEPTENRNGILLNSDQPKPKKNRYIIEKAVDAVIKFNEWLIEQNVSNTYLIASSRKPIPQEPWDEQYAKPWIENLQKQWRKRLINQTLVETSSGYDRLGNIQIPDYGSKEGNKNFYNFLKDFIRDGILPFQNQQDEWSNIIFAEYPSWNANLKYTKQDFFEDLQRVGSVTNLCTRLNFSEIECYKWLNELFKFVEEQGDEEYLEKYPVIPNQSGDFCLLGSVFTDSVQRIPDRLKDICDGMLNRNLYDELISEKIFDQVFKKMREYTLTSLITDINKLIHEAREKRDIVYQSEWNVISSCVYGILSLKTNDEEGRQTLRDQMYSFVSTFVVNIPVQEYIADLPDTLWDEADIFILKSIPSLIEKYASSLNELGMKMLINPQEHSDEESIGWINKYSQLCKNYNFNIAQTAKIYPDQKGNLKALETLHYDNAIPEEFKTLALKATNEDWHSKLLDSRIIGYEQYNVLSVKDIYDCIKESFDSCNDNLKLEIAKNAICLIPESSQIESSDNKQIYILYQKVDNSIGNNCIIMHADGFYWEIFGSYVLKFICKFIAESENIDKLSDKTDQDIESAIQYVDDVIDFVETRYGKRYIKYVEEDYGVWLNQNGDFCPFKEISKDNNINESLKEIATNKIVNIDYKEKLLYRGMRCEYYISDTSTINNKAILVNIDDAIRQYIEDGLSFQDTHFAALVFELDRLVKENPSFEKDLKIFENNHDRLIVGTIGDKKTLAIVGALVSSPDKLELINEIFNYNYEKAELWNLLNKLKEKGPSAIFDISGKDGLVEISLSDTPYGGLTIDQMHDVLKEAKEVVRNEMESQGFTFTKGICEESYGNIYGVMKDNVEYPLVVHSYKNNSRPFQLTAFDWEQLAKPHSMLWVNTYEGIKCIPFYALAKERGAINISFAAENFDIADRSIALAQVLRYYKGLHFDFGQILPVCDSQSKFFNQPEKPISEVLNAKEDNMMC